MTYKTKRRAYKTRATNPGDRNYKDPRYVQFRREVKKRDGNMCQMCKTTKRLKVHHIKRWADAPGLRFMTQNGITICYTCHERITGNEDAYRSMFTMMVSINTHKNNSPLSGGDAASREATGDVP